VNRPAAETISVILAVFARVEPALHKSITFDNDTVFAQHALLRTMRAMTTWFCDAYASWQKGGVENANGRLRRLFCAPAGSTTAATSGALAAPSAAAMTALRRFGMDMRLSRAAACR
jgi:IS30 family transposase